MTTTTDMKLVGFEENYATAERRLHEALNAVHWLMVSSPKNKDNVLKIFELLGKTLIVNSEKKLHSITALSGSGPAYFFNFYEALLSTGKELGLSKKEILLLVKQTAIGATAMFCETKEPINILRENVTSKGGTTEIGLETLKKYEFAKGVLKAVLSAKARSIELGSELNSKIQENTQK